MKPTRNSVFVYALVIITIVMIGVVAFQNYPFLKSNTTLMASINFRGTIVGVNYVESSTSENVIQISTGVRSKRKIIKNVIKNNSLVGFSVKNDSTLIFIFNLEGPFKNKSDTIEMVIPKDRS